MEVKVQLSGPELAEHLARTLSNVEFELLVRSRIKLLFAEASEAYPNLSESHHRCFFHMSWGDEAQWDVGIGETYAKRAEAKGQVLSLTVRDAMAAYSALCGNKLSLLLSAPTATTFDDDPIPF